MTKTVCVLTNFRTGSTAFTLIKSEEYGLPYKGELFSHERPWDYGDVLARWKELETMRDDPTHPGFDNSRPIKRIFMDEIKKKNPICFKLMPDQVCEIWRNDGCRNDFEIAADCDKVYLLYRRDWRRQALSWVGMRCNGEFGKNGLKHDRRSGDPRLVDFHWNMHVGTEYKVEKVVREIKIRDLQFVNLVIEQLMNNYKRLAQLYKEIPNIELVCMEDYFAGTPYLPYNHEFVWLDGEPEIPEFDVEGLFKS